jgi:hypothetical protein
MSFLRPIRLAKSSVKFCLATAVLGLVVSLTAGCGSEANPTAVPVEPVAAENVLRTAGPSIVSIYVTVDDHVVAQGVGFIAVETLNPGKFSLKKNILDASLRFRSENRALSRFVVGVVIDRRLLETKGELVAEFSDSVRALAGVAYADEQRGLAMLEVRYYGKAPRAALVVSESPLKPDSSIYAATAVDRMGTRLQDDDPDRYLTSHYDGINTASVNVKLAEQPIIDETDEGRMKNTVGSGHRGALLFDDQARVVGIAKGNSSTEGPIDLAVSNRELREFIRTQTERRRIED